MSDPITIRLPGVPRGKGRHRARAFTVPGKGIRTQTYSDEKTRAYEGRLQDAAGAVMAGRVPLTGPLHVAIFAFMPIPASFSKRKRLDAIERRLRPTTKPDWDNIAKVCDALNKIVWGDDASVVDGFVRKFYAEVPELVIEVRAINVGGEA